MNGGIHDAMNLTTRLAEVWHGRAANAALELFDRERRLVTIEYIDQQSTQNKRNLESDGVALKTNLEAIAADPLLMREYLMRVSMIASLARAKELGATPP
jgi:3-(3-hydroxy-phenyl)propionate hydroxylase